MAIVGGNSPLGCKAAGQRASSHRDELSWNMSFLVEKKVVLNNCLSAHMGYIWVHGIPYITPKVFYVHWKMMFYSQSRLGVSSIFRQTPKSWLRGLATPHINGSPKGSPGPLGWSSHATGAHGLMVQRNPWYTSWKRWAQHPMILASNSNNYMVFFGDILYNMVI